MSNTTVYPLDTSVSYPIYEQARTNAKARAAAQWTNENFNMWTTYNTTLNPDWVDPWFEHELSAIYNGPGTTASPDSYEMTQNLYMIYCWLKYKGWSDYAITAFTTGTIQASTMTGGLWQSMIHPYASLEGFNASAIFANNAGRSPWYIGTDIATWTAEAYDEYTQETVYLTAGAGSWDAVRKYKILMTAESIEGHIYIRPEYPLTFNRTSGAATGYQQMELGYGLVQWTNYDRLITKAGLVAQDGDKHWQLNLTLQLMVLEFEREQAMTHQGQQQGSDYLGEWVDDNADDAYIEINGGIYHYPYSSCTWNDWRDDLPVQRFADYMLSTHGIELTLWQKIHMMMDIFRVCYIHSPYADFDFETKSRYVWNAIQYWNNNGGWDVRDIPRPRDIPESELDKYHISKAQLLLMVGRRKKHGVRTILL